MRKNCCLIFLPVLFQIGCAISIKGPLKELDPWSKNFDNAVENVKESFTKKENRESAYPVIEKQLNRSYLSYKQQIRISIFMVLLFHSQISEEEQQIIKNMVQSNRNHKHFFGFFFMGLESTSPTFIKESIDILKQKEALKFFMPGHDGRKKQYSLKEVLIQNLEESTKKQFGDNPELWERWWETEGQYLKYDREKEVYIYTSESGPPDKTDNSDSGVN